MAAAPVHDLRFDRPRAKILQQIHEILVILAMVAESPMYIRDGERTDDAGICIHWMNMRLDPKV